MLGTESVSAASMRETVAACMLWCRGAPSPICSHGTPPIGRAIEVSPGMIPTFSARRGASLFRRPIGCAERCFVRRSRRRPCRRGRRARLRPCAPRASASAPDLVGETGCPGRAGLLRSPWPKAWRTAAAAVCRPRGHGRARSPSGARGSAAGLPRGRARSRSCGRQGHRRTRVTPARPRAFAPRRSPVRNVPASEAPAPQPMISRRPSVLTAAAIIAEAGAMRPPWRIFGWVAPRHPCGRSPASGRPGNAPSRSSMSVQGLETAPFETPPIRASRITAAGATPEARRGARKPGSCPAAASAPAGSACRAGCRARGRGRGNRCDRRHAPRRARAGRRRSRSPAPAAMIASATARESRHHRASRAARRGAWRSRPSALYCYTSLR